MPPVQTDSVQVGSNPTVTDHSDSESDSDIMAVAPEKFDGHMDPTDWLDDLVAYYGKKRKRRKQTMYSRRLNETTFYATKLLLYHK